MLFILIIKKDLSLVTEKMKLENNWNHSETESKNNYKSCHLHIKFKIEFIKVTYSGAIQGWMVEKNESNNPKFIYSRGWCSDYLTYNTVIINYIVTECKDW